MKIFITRHGQTEWNQEGRIQGRTDIALNEIGKEQAKKLKDELKQTPIDIIFCSSLKRAKETASIIRGNRDIPMIEDNRLIERGYGNMEGKLRKDNPCPTQWEVSTQGEETLKSLFERTQDFLEEIYQRYPHSSILIVSHGGTIIPMQCFLEQISPEHRDKIAILKNCEILQYEYHKN